MNKIINYLQKKEFLKYFMVIFSGTLLAQLITVLMSLVLTRLYTPAEFGVYGTYTAFVALLIVFTTGRYEFAINTAENEEDALTLFKIVNILSLCFSIVVFILILFFATEIKTLLNFNSDYQLLYYIPLTLFLMGLLQGSIYFLNRKKKFSILAKSKVYQSIGNGVSATVGGVFGIGAIGIILGNVVGLGTSYAYQKLKLPVNNVSKVNFTKIKKNLIEYKQYPLYNSPSAFFDSLAIQAPILILLRFFSEVTVGYFSLTTRVIGMPLGLISTSISQVFLSQISELHRSGKSYKYLVIKIAKYLFLIALVPLIIIGGFGPKLFAFFFGEEWKIAGEFARILSIGYFFKFIVAPLSVIFFINQKVKLLSIIQVLRAFSTITLLYITSKHYNLETVLLTYSIHEALFYLVYFFFIMKTSK